MLAHKLKLEYGEEKVDGRKVITECTKSISSGDRDFDKHAPISAGMQKLIITCAKSKLAKQADEELKFGLSADPKASEMLVSKPAGELQTVMAKEHELRIAMLERERQMDASQRAIEKHQRLVAQLATSHTTRQPPSAQALHAADTKALAARDWLVKASPIADVQCCLRRLRRLQLIPHTKCAIHQDRARQASDLSAEEALRKMTPTELRRKLASIQELLRRGVKDGIVVAGTASPPVVCITTQGSMMRSVCCTLPCQPLQASVPVVRPCRRCRAMPNVDAVGRRRLRSLHGARRPKRRSPLPARRSFLRSLRPRLRRHRRLHLGGLHLRWLARLWRRPPPSTPRHVALPAPKVPACLGCMILLTFGGMASGSEGRGFDEKDQPGANILARTSHRGAHTRGGSWTTSRTSSGQFPEAASGWLECRRDRLPDAPLSCARPAP